MRRSRFLVAGTLPLPPTDLVKQISKWCLDLSGGTAELVTGPEAGVSRFFQMVAEEDGWLLHYNDSSPEGMIEGACDCHKELVKPRLLLAIIGKWDDAIARQIGLVTDAGIGTHVWTYPNDWRDTIGQSSRSENGEEGSQESQESNR